MTPLARLIFAERHGHSGAETVKENCSKATLNIL